MGMLSDIDEELIDDILEIPQTPEGNIGAVKAKGGGIFLRFALPIAACLAIAAVSAGVLIFNNENTVIEPENSTSEISETMPSEVTEKDLESCRRYMEFNIYDYGRCEFDVHAIDLDFDGTCEIMFFPRNARTANIHVFFKTNGSYGYCGEINAANGEYPLYGFEDLKLFDGEGEKYYYYYYYDTTREEKGIAAVNYSWHRNLEVKSLLSYGSSDTEEGIYRKKGDEYVKDPEEFEKLWAKYKEAPPVNYEEYWNYELVNIKNAPYLSDLLANDSLPYIKDDNYNLRRDNFYEGTAEKAIISQMDCGNGYKASVLGHYVIVYEREGEKYASCYKSELVISDDSGDTVSVCWAKSPYVRIEGSGWDIPLWAVESCMDTVDFGDSQIVMLRDSLLNSVCERTQLIGVKNGIIYPCGCVGMEEDERFYYTPYISGMYSVQGAGTDAPTLFDELTKIKYVFDFRLADDAFYYVAADSTSPEYGGEAPDIGGYTPVEETEIPFIDVSGLSFKEKTRYVAENSLPKVLLAQDSVAAGDSAYNLYLICENMRISRDASEEYIYCNNLRTAVFKDGEYLGSVTSVYTKNNSVMSIGTSYSEYIAKGYYCKEYDALLILKTPPVALFDNYYGSNCFAAVKDERLYPELGGTGKDISENPAPKWTEEGIDNYEIEVVGNELRCGANVYRFNFGNAAFGTGQYDYEVLWRKERPD